MGCEFHCSICGARMVRSHRCAQSVLNAIDAAHQRAGEEDREYKPSFTKRLKDGMETMYSCEDEDE
jgi:hypothetical protein